jgi:hypothetical protein
MKTARSAALSLCLSAIAATMLPGCSKLTPSQSGEQVQAEHEGGLAGVRSAIVARDFAEAVTLAAAEVVAHPKDPTARFEQARAEALVGNQGRALAGLDQAIALGLPDAARALEDPAFAALRGSEQFVALADRASPTVSDAGGTTIVAGRGRRASNDSVVLHERDGGGTHIEAGDVVLDTDF